MKKAIVLLSLIFISLVAISQNARMDGSGNYVAVKSVQDSAKATGKTFTDSKGIVYQLMQSAKGKLYYTRISKTGNEYKVYLKLDN